MNVSVPVDPTPEMLRAGFSADDLATAWALMLAARPAATPGGHDAEDAKRYIADWCPDHVKDYIDSLSTAATPGGEREALDVFADDVTDVQSRYIVVHQLRASADIQDRETKRETGWATTSDRAELMRKAADTIERLAALSRPAPVAGEAVDLESGEARVAVVNIVERYVSGWAGEHADNPYDAAPLLAREILDALAAPTPQPAAARGGEDVWNTDMGAAPTDGRPVIAIDKWGNTSHARYDDSLPKGFPEAGPKGWVHAKTGHKLETRFECFAAWTFAPNLSALSAKGGS